MTRTGRRLTVLSLATALAVLTACGTSDDPAFTADPEPPAEEDTTAVTGGRDEAVVEAMGQEALDALGLSPAELCATVARWEDPGVNAIVFLQPDAAAAEIATVEGAVRALDPDAKYVSQEEAFVEFTEELFAGNDALLELVTPDLLPASFRMAIPDDEVGAAADELEALPEVRRVLTERPVFSEQVDAACDG
ncbi:MAG: permease-like cell division protein FtsX [Actinomycetota bacterium]